jgi:chemotaxis protein MotB
VLDMPQAVLFAPGEDEMGPEARQNVRKLARILRDVPNRVALIGYADATPIHNSRFNDNWELAAARSLRLLDVLVSEFGIDSARLSISSYGSNNPKSSNDSEESRAPNRRVEIIVEDEPSPSPSPVAASAPLVPPDTTQSPR